MEPYKKYVIYSDYDFVWKYMFADIIDEPNEKTKYYKYEGLFADGVYGQSFVTPDHIFDTEDGAIGYCKTAEPPLDLRKK